MKIDTLRFGEIEVEDKLIFDFVMPVIGFDNLSKFVIIDSSKEALFKWLQSVEDPALAFPIISVAGLDYDYSVELTDSVVETLEIENADDLLVMNITSIPQENPHGTTINLLAPLIFNLKNQKAAQIVLSGSGYDISYPMFKKV
ncbi:flagellar assembly protein FliW [bacterium]|nr:flagellar assembly protein FliW [bacterium]